ncbi:zinc finger protein 438 [Dromiciops gliroides]|uniref:zinc finger protein 438 n=1 Tax=Dromiciops gliroides TaxID=33562 RepID=UPI001CC82A6E|nr:zinc finger protein 438 [Dromiciops gliroides]XP_043825207.1 zinc finger protein 438 [Dromiciops gliroides]XP_043825208.1 zinc finger protein 438 [Dromiciops gliroides]XP_043825209.1 zinc finger protein 438 [Dromiciops gliroides]XP_043825210.1 zinc finger protein 438 [Dromiciops gliroides]
MENSLLVPPKDQDEPKISPWTTQTGKSLQNKIQFRTIAPKITPKVLTSPVLPYQSPSLCDQVHPMSSANSRPLVMPPQNYALMQVAGQEGTFSLVALPQVTPAVTTPPVQKPKNLKLPIPRYQPTRNKKMPEVETIPNSSVSVIRKVPANTQICAQPSPSIANHSELHTNIDSSEHVIVIDQVPTEITVTALLDESSCVESGPPLISRPEAGDTVIFPKPWVPEEASAELGNSMKAKLDTNTMARKPSAMVIERIREKVADSAKAMTVLSPAIFGNAVQLIPAAPKGKLPILPYSRMKTAMSKPDASIVGPASWHRPNCDKAASFAKTFDVPPKTSDKLFAVSLTQVSKPAACRDAFCSVTKVEVDNKKKLNGGTARKRGRKRRMPEDVLAFQTKKRKCVLDTCRDVQERVKTDPQELRDRKAGTVKKYRNIMPKPVVVMQAVSPLTSPAPPVQTKSPDYVDTMLENPLTNKHPSSKQSDSACTKPGPVCKNGFSAIRKPWHRCHICNHHFQFKHHLQDHMNTHTNRRPYSCRICRKAYVHSGSLSTHMKLHHSESRLKKLLCCEFCAKVFGHVRVYIGHLKEVHRVVINTEPSSGELPQGRGPKNREIGVRGTEEAVERENKAGLEETLFPGQASEVKLDIKCGRCQVTAQSFSEMKCHLLYVHGEDIQGKLKEGVLPSSRGAQEEVVKRAAHFWKQRSERRSLAKRDALEEEAYTFPIQLKREIYLLHQKNLDILTKSEEAPLGAGEPGKAPPSPDCATPYKIQVWSDLGFNCLLCKQTLERKEELFLHWEQQHNCEDPSVLWALLSALSSQGVIELSNEAEK